MLERSVGTLAVEGTMFIHINFLFQIKLVNMKLDSMPMNMEYVNSWYNIETVNVVTNSKSLLSSICGLDISELSNQANYSEFKSESRFHEGLNLLMALESALNKHHALDQKLARNMIKAVMFTLSVYPTSLICWSQDKELAKEAGHLEMVDACADIISMIVSKNLQMWLIN